MRRGALRVATGIGAAAVVAAGGLALTSGLAARRAERLVPADGRFVTVDGVRLHYVDIGAGPTIVMVHGLYGQLRNFTFALAERLAADFRVVALDRPGSGYSAMPRGGAATLAGQARLVAGFMDALGLDPALVVGHSLGGALALALALDRPDLVTGLALVCPLTQPLADVPEVFRPLVVRSRLRRRLLAWTLAVPMARRGQDKARHVVFHPDPVPTDFETRGGGALTLRPGAFYAASGEVSAGTGEIAAMAARYQALRVPVAILFGDRDRVLSPALHGERTMEALRHGTFETIEGGHMLPLTQPQAVADWIREQAGG